MIKPIEQLYHDSPSAIKDFVERPANLRVLPGVRQRHDGRFYKLGQYPSGKTVELPYTPVNAPPARTIPVPEEVKPKQRRASGPKFVRTAHVIELRDATSKDKFVQTIDDDRVKKIKFSYPDIETFNNMLAFIKPFSRSPDCGKTWIPMEPIATDWHQCYHLNEEQQA